MKYPGPWKLEHYMITDANGCCVVDEFHVPDYPDDDGNERGEPIERLVLAAPELLEALRNCVDRLASLREWRYRGGITEPKSDSEEAGRILLSKLSDPVARPQPQPAVPGPSR